MSFLDTGTQISQVTQEHDAKCLLFTTVADIDPSAQMSLLVDFNNDGTIDFQGPLGATDWHQVQAEVTAPKGYDGITFHLRKEGTGTAVLAEMRVVSTTGCAAPAPHAPFRLGESCVTASDCSAGLFCTTDGFCAQCGAAASCPDGVTMRDARLPRAAVRPRPGTRKVGRPLHPARGLREPRVRRVVPDVDRRGLRTDRRRVPDVGAAVRHRRLARQRIGGLRLLPDPRRHMPLTRQRQVES